MLGARKPRRTQAQNWWNAIDRTFFPEGAQARLVTRLNSGGFTVFTKIALSSASLALAGGIALAACGSSGHGTPSGGGDPHVHNIPAATSQYKVSMTSCGTTAGFEVRNVKGPTAPIGVTVEFVGTSDNVADTNSSFTDPLSGGLGEHLSVAAVEAGGHDYTGHVARCVATWHHMAGKSPAGTEHPIASVAPATPTRAPPKPAQPQSSPPSSQPRAQQLCSPLGCAPANQVTYYQGGWYFITGPDTYVGTIRPPGFTGGEPKAPMNAPGHSNGPPSNGAPDPNDTPNAQQQATCCNANGVAYCCGG